MSSHDWSLVYSGHTASTGASGTTGSAGVYSDDTGTGYAGGDENDWNEENGWAQWYLHHFIQYNILIVSNHNCI